MTDTNWREGLPSDVQEWEEAKTADSPEKFWKQMADHRRLLGRAIVPPSSEASTEQRQQFYDKLLRLAPDLMPKPNPDDADAFKATLRALGMPDTPDGYELPAVEGITLDGDRAAYLRGLAAKAGLTKQQAKAFIEGVLGEEAAAASRRRAALQSEQEALRGEWGADHARRVETLVAVAEKTGAPEGLVAKARNGELTAAETKWLYQIAEQYRPEGTPAATAPASQQSRRLTPHEAADRIHDIRNNKEHPFNNPGHRDHADWVNNRMPELYRLRAAQEG